jgi:hypothetical protein
VTEHSSSSNTPTPRNKTKLSFKPLFKLSSSFVESSASNPMESQSNPRENLPSNLLIESSAESVVATSTAPPEKTEKTKIESAAAPTDRAA